MLVIICQSKLEILSSAKKSRTYCKKISRESLEQQLCQQVSELQFLEADKTQRRIEKVKAKQARLQVEALKAQHQTEHSAIQSHYHTELDELNQLWESRFEEFKATCLAAEQELEAKQEQAYAEQEQSLEDRLPQLSKSPSEVLNIKKMQDVLVKQAEYRQAYFLQRQIEQLSQEAHTKWAQERQEKIARSLAHLRKKHDQERQNYRKKAVAAFNELKRQKAAELEALHKRFNNLSRQAKMRQSLDCAQLSTDRSGSRAARLLTARSSLLERFSQCEKE